MNRASNASCVQQGLEEQVVSSAVLAVILKKGKHVSSD